jgi:hypothetical protein
MNQWWKTIEAQLDQHSELAPDPWAEAADDAVELTDEQRRFLAAFDRRRDRT